MTAALYSCSYLENLSSEKAEATDPIAPFLPWENVRFDGEESPGILCKDSKLRSFPDGRTGKKPRKRKHLAFSFRSIGYSLSERKEEQTPC